MKVYNARSRRTEELREGRVIPTRRDEVAYVDEEETGEFVIRNAVGEERRALEEAGARFDDEENLWRYPYETLDDGLDFLRKLEGFVAIRDQFMAALGDWSGAVIHLECGGELPGGEPYDAEVYLRET